MGEAARHDVQGVVRGDEAALRALLRRYNQRLFRTARAILRDDAEAEEAVQDAWMKALRALPEFRGEARLSTWLVRIAANEALSRRRRLVRESPIVALGAEGLEAVEATLAAPAHEEPEAASRRDEVRRAVERHIDALPEAFRAVFMLRGVEEMPVEEVAAALDIPAATVRTRFFRARALLREALARDVDAAIESAYAFAGARCDRISAWVVSAWSESRMG